MIEATLFKDGKPTALVSVLQMEDLEAYVDRGYTYELGHQTLPVSIHAQLLAIRNRRNVLLDTQRWTIMPDSPLANTEEWLVYLQQLQRVTIGLVDPAEVSWPTPPEFVYAEVG